MCMWCWMMMIATQQALFCKWFNWRKMRGTDYHWVHMYTQHIDGLAQDGSNMALTRRAGMRISTTCDVLLSKKDKTYKNIYVVHSTNSRSSLFVFFDFLTLWYVGDLELVYCSLMFKIDVWKVFDAAMPYWQSFKGQLPLGMPRSAFDHLSPLRFEQLPKLKPECTHSTWGPY